MGKRRGELPLSIFYGAKKGWAGMQTGWARIFFNVHYIQGMKTVLLIGWTKKRTRVIVESNTLWKHKVPSFL